MLSKTAVKYIQSLTFKKFRSEKQEFIVEGPKIIDEFLKDPTFKLSHLYATSEYIQEDILLKSNLLNKLTVISSQELSKISLLSAPNKVLGIFKFREKLEIGEYVGKILVLDSISDPGNLGTIIRIADWYGLNNILCSSDCVDFYSPKVVQSSMGSILRVNLSYVDLIHEIKKKPDYPCFAAVLDGLNIHKINKPNDCFIIIGNESKGISEQLLKLASQKISIPRIGKAESLNAAVATGIIIDSFSN